MLPNIYATFARNCPRDVSKIAPNLVTLIAREYSMDRLVDKQ